MNPFKYLLRRWMDFLHRTVDQETADMRKTVKKADLASNKKNRVFYFPTRINRST